MLLRTRTRCYQFDREDGEVVHRDQDALDADVGAVGKEIDAVVVDGDDDDKQQCLRRATAAVGVGIAAGDVHAGGDVDYGHDADADVVGMVMTLAAMMVMLLSTLRRVGSLEHIGKWINSFCRC